MKQEMQGLIIEIIILIITIISTSTFFLTYTNEYNNKLNKMLAYNADYSIENISSPKNNTNDLTTAKTIKITPIIKQPAQSYLILKIKKTNNINNIKIKINEQENYLSNYEASEIENYLYYTIYTIKTNQNLQLTFDLWQEENSSPTIEYSLLIEKNKI